MRDPLDQITVNGKCELPFDQFQGEGNTRFCDSCQFSVHDLSSMTRAEGLQLLSSAGSDRLCVSYLRSATGEVITKDCSTKAPAKRKPRILSLALGLLTGSFLAACQQPPPPAETERLTGMAAKGKIVYVVKELREGEAIPEDALQESEVIQSKIPQDSITSSSIAKGRIAKYRIAVGQVLCQHDFLPHEDELLTVELTASEAKELDRQSKIQKKSKRKLITEWVRSKLNTSSTK